MPQCLAAEFSNLGHIIPAFLRCIINMGKVGIRRRLWFSSILSQDYKNAVSGDGIPCPSARLDYQYILSQLIPCTAWIFSKRHRLQRNHLALTQQLPSDKPTKWQLVPIRERELTNTIGWAGKYLPGWLNGGCFQHYIPFGHFRRHHLITPMASKVSYSHDVGMAKSNKNIVTFIYWVTKLVIEATQALVEPAFASQWSSTYYE